VTEQEIAKFMTRLHEEDEMLQRDQVCSFDGSLIWKQLTERMSQDVLQDIEPTDGQDRAE
jgi:hypothetical protein